MLTETELQLHKKFLDKVAKEAGFDAEKDTHMWATITEKDVTSKVVCYSATRPLMSQCNNIAY